MQFCSSRTLPGQAYASSRSAAALEIDFTGLPAVAAKRSRSAARARGRRCRARERRHLDAHDVDAIEEILAEASLVDRALRDRGSSPRRCARRTGSPCRHRRGAPCAPAARAGASPAPSSGISPISSRNSVPPLACKKRPARATLRVGEGAARVAEELALEQRLGHRRAVDGDERPRGAAAALVDRARDELLAACRSRR